MKPSRAANSLLRGNVTPGRSLRTSSALLQNRRTYEVQPAPSPLSASTSTTPWQPPIIARPFCYTPTRHRKRKIGSNNNVDGNPNHQYNSTTTGPPPRTSTSKASPVDDADMLNPFDFTDLQTAFDRAEKRYLDDLKKLRTGGRFNADTVGAIRVQPDKKSPQTFPLRELATVAPLGARRWSILAFEEASVKPIISAVQKSDEFNQQPQRSEENPLELTMTVEPERAEALVKRAKDVCQAWRTRVREEAHKRGELHKKWRAEKLVLNDDMYKLREKLQKLQDEMMKVILVKEKEVVAGIMARGS
ncbi:ribosome recycling factor [Parathielavia appendiculata]|uniref:Ribosome recycling factor n=1 Tax=Parathielavia appendiculata TaxID=2587402 RepID=A0AAN6Z962_9PEZI|nr:ribosome recycling factor [Parathielavia appendiculata]